jgi:hypothetical protein
MKVGSATLSDPFYHESIYALRVRGRESAEFETHLSILETGAAGLARVVPAGIIFHMSRCGSTLLLNALRTADSVVALSEPAPADRAMAMAAARSTHWARLGTALLTPLISVFAHYQGPARSVIVKCSSLSTFSLRAVRTVWPDVPCIFLIRNPVEVVVSNWLRPPRWLSDWSKQPEKFWLGSPPPEVKAAGGVELALG